MLYTQISIITFIRLISSPLLSIFYFLFSSTFTSIRSLRYVIFPVQVLFKSCKPVPVMIFGTLLGKRYPIQKYVNVVIITTGVALFMGGGSGAGGGETSLLGALMLSISLCFDGATGAYEDKLMGQDHVGPFDLMYNIQLGKAVIAFVVIVATNQLSEFLATVHTGGFMLFVLGFTGAFGQVFVFVTISKFGALNCALIGLGRKILSLCLSFLLYGHSLNSLQVVGLGLSLAAMIANFYEKGGSKKAEEAADKKAAPPDEKISLLSDTDVSESDGFNLTPGPERKSQPNARPVEDLLDFEIEFEEMDGGMAKDISRARGGEHLEDLRVLGKDLQASVEKRYPDTFREIKDRIEEKIQSPWSTSTGIGNFV